MTVRWEHLLRNLLNILNTIHASLIPKLALIKKRHSTQHAQEQAFIGMLRNVRKSSCRFETCSAHHFPLFQRFCPILRGSLPAAMPIS